ncbi:NAD(P)-dependent dehydrogenase, short-chain alcohol dehydrogenase family [Paraburkholderia fungorum]|uniref:NAD(P)-dependent dehydrogenase, short-chain alcohol dehydrogenase family n=1 Tax=Paraburkholderia fungorum TaxID=134537 RepID=A0A1H1H6F3_9BURK|nr:SDR family NAD(P)-dependent oxidoreductase [Paraburkholderia fungorum]SDR20943.1 NAD(P)-dependent dehydrogenase, short-chain alcohol dehydrogenase family [Paraburkholderia fungorum]
MNTDTQTAIVTGASSGIGFAITKAFLALGFNVVGNARTDQRLKAAAAQLGDTSRFLHVAGDIADPAVAGALFDTAITHFGFVDILVNCAGAFIAKPVGDYTEEDLDLLISTNLKGFFYPAQLAARHMAANGAGHIINITASIAMQPNVRVPSVIPALVKGGINAATRALALELAAHNVKVNAIAPGVIDTPLHEPGAIEHYRALAPSGTVGTTSDVVDAVLYLVRSSFVTGVVVPVDGGSTAGVW